MREVEICDWGAGRGGGIGDGGRCGDPVDIGQM